MIGCKSLRILWVVLPVILLIMLAARPAGAASAPQALSDGELVPRGPRLQAGCGDRICDSYMGENSSTCPQDCAVTLAPTAFSVATMTRGLLTRAPTVSATASISATSLSTEASPVSSGTPGGGPVITPLPSAGGLAPLPGCDLATYESRAQAWQKGYGSKASPDTFIPSRIDDREIYICNVQPVGDVCIPIYQGLIKASGETMDNIVLVDCSTEGTCQIYEGPSRQVGESICFNVTQADGLSCSAGCALVPRSSDVFVLSLLGNVPVRTLAPAACLAALLIIGVALGIVFVTRRSRRRELPSNGASQTPSGWDTIPRSGRIG